ncbi:class I adenylate-forming enzyme family protein [Phycisphaerales bacterium AB-hyl4]|uniref:Class I adenylate-forming enzyme family protein n=1 Tax=Natronomicrosphaera hydrolytica TaxID=3242702 RepID=A0ABV4UAM3_9BACT
MSLLWPILKHAFTAPRTTAVVDDMQSYSYLKLAAAGLFMANKIAKTTDKKHVGVMLPSSGGFAAAMLGTWMLGRVLVPLNFLLKKEDLAYIIRDSDIDTILTVPQMLEFLGGRDSLPAETNVVELAKADFKGLPRPRWPKSAKDDDLAVILYTSGTSGKPKGVMLSHGNLHRDVDAAIEHAGLSSADTFLGVLPQFHSFGLTALTLLPLRLKSRVVYSARFVPKKVVELIREHRPEIFMGVPSMYGAMLSVKDATKEDFSSVRIPISGGEPLPDALYDACKEKIGIELLEGYGLTETSPIATWATPTQKKRHSVGRALPGVTVVTVDDNDKPQGANEEGEIVIAGPIIMQGYYKRDDLTDEVMFDLQLPDRDKPIRAFRTGDIGHIDDEGYVFITGRKKEMLIIGGENVFPREIEEVLNKHESVKASAVIGKADDMRGEVPIAFVEVEDDAEFDAGKVRSHCRELLAQYKVPREIHVVDELPRSPTGKVLRRELKNNSD